MAVFCRNVNGSISRNMGMKESGKNMTGEHWLMLAALGVGGILWFVWLRSMVSRRK